LLLVLNIGQMDFCLWI